ncbi:hypothetical protein OPIT5_19600 [Opitutaceae bacterium TAV5]|nr:hypothetical protein OPIT5_19600 [Opitutaceae bacterium TAV5]
MNPIIDGPTVFGHIWGIDLRQFYISMNRLNGMMKWLPKIPRVE